MNEKTISELRTKVYEAVGESSMTWNPIPSGIYDSTRAKGIGDRLMEEILSRYTPTENKGGDNPWRALDTLKRHKHPNHGGEFLYAPDVYNALSDRRPASPTKADKVEPLAVLADRKGYAVYSNNRRRKIISHKPWHIALTFIKNNNARESFYADTYAAAENLARAFLTGLDDVTGKGGR